MNVIHLRHVLLFELNPWMVSKCRRRISTKLIVMENSTSPSLINIDDCSCSLDCFSALVKYFPFPSQDPSIYSAANSLYVDAMTHDRAHTSSVRNKNLKLNDRDGVTREYKNWERDKERRVLVW